MVGTFLKFAPCVCLGFWGPVLNRDSIILLDWLYSSEKVKSIQTFIDLVDDFCRCHFRIVQLRSVLVYM